MNHRQTRTSNRSPKFSDMARTRTKIAVLGAGNMGTAMAHALAGSGHEVVVWDFFPEVVVDIREARENRRFLPGVTLHAGIRATPNARECVVGASLIVLSVPSAFASSTLMPVLPFLEKNAVLLSVVKGFAPGTWEPLLFVLGRLAPGHACVHLAGPAIANEFARGVATSVVVAGIDERIASRVAKWLQGPTIIPAITDDVAGATLSGILKNVYAIIFGCLQSLSGAGRNIEAAALTTCLQEMSQIAVAHGARQATVYGLAGLGDLIVTSLSPDSHNRKFGQMLASGRPVAQIEKEIRWLPEGARAASAACAMAQSGGVSAPLARWVRRVLAGTPPSLDGLSRALRASTRKFPE